MPYQSSSFGDVIPLLKRTLAGTIDFSGRSRVTEVVYYWIAVVALRMLSAVIFLVASVSFETISRIGIGLALLPAVPMFALFVRRLHDQGRSGWWAAPLPLAILLSAPGMISQWNGDFDALLAPQFPIVDSVGVVVGLVGFILCLLPGTEGSNEYGSDPRLDEN